MSGQRTGDSAHGMHTHTRTHTRVYRQPITYACIGTHRHVKTAKKTSQERNRGTRKNRSIEAQNRSISFFMEYKSKNIPHMPHDSDCFDFLLK